MVNALPEKIYPRLCQMRLAPYSYDWLDNFGRKSPVELTPGITNLQLGQVFMTGFELVSFEHNRHVTIRSRNIPSWQFIFGDIVLTYMICPIDFRTSRLLVKMRVGYSRHLVVKSLMRLLLPPGDTFMMYKQLRTFRDLSESQY